MRKPEEILEDLKQLAEEVRSPEDKYPYEWGYYANAMLELEKELQALVDKISDKR